IVCPWVPVIQDLIARLHRSLISIPPLDECSSGALALGDVAGDAQHFGRLIAIVDQSRAYIQRDSVAVPSDYFQLVSGRIVGGNFALDHPPRKFQMLRSDDLRNVHPAGFFTGVSREHFTCTVQRREVAREIVRVDYVVGVIKQVVVAALAFTQPMHRALSTPAFDQEDSDECSLKGNECEDADDPALVLFPGGQLLEADDAVGWQKSFADAPALKLAPVKHGDNRQGLDRDVLRPLTVCNPQGNFRCPGRSRRVNANLTANDSITDLPTDHPIDGDWRRSRNQAQDITGL